MKIFKVGDTQQAVCETCATLRPVTFGLHDVPFSDGSGTVRQVLAGACDACGQVCVVPQQSVPAITEALAAGRQSVESRLPAHLLDVLALATFELGAPADFTPSLMKCYLHHLVEDTASASRLTRLLASDLARGPAQKRLSLKGRHVADDIASLQQRHALRSATEVIKATVLAIHEDILVQRNPERLAELRRLAAAVA